MTVARLLRGLAVVFTASCSLVEKEHSAAATGSTPVTELRPTTNCAQCKITARKVATLDGAQFDMHVPTTRLALNSRGQYIASGRTNELGLFDGSGKLLGKFGRDGKGPGEFSSIHQVEVGNGDTVFVRDGALARVTVLDPSLTRLIRTVSVPSSVDQQMLVLDNGQWLMGGQSIDRGAPFNVLHLVGSNGTLLRSFSEDTSVANWDAANRARNVRALPVGVDRVMSRSLAHASNGNTLVALHHRYAVELWSSDWQLLRTFERNVSWFPPVARGVAFGDFILERWPAQLYGVSMDSASAVVIVTMLQGSSGKRPPVAMQSLSEGPAVAGPRDENTNNYFETIVEAFDPAAGEVLASNRFPGIYGPISHSAYHFSHRELPSGDLVIDIVKFELTGRPAHTK